MAAEGRHAAWQIERRFAVRLLPEQGGPTDLASGLPEFLAAVDVACEWLNREDPARDGKTRLSIVETCDDEAKEVWSYPPSPRSAGQELVELFGFNPAAWQPHGPENPVGEQKRRWRPPPAAPQAASSAAGIQPDSEDPTLLPSDSSPSAPPNADYADEAAGAPRAAIAQPRAPLAAHAVPVDAEADAVGEERSILARTRTSIAARARATWEDSASRCCLVLAAASLWLSLTLADPAFLALLLIAVPPLWLWRHRTRSLIADPDEWL